jgi:hypothetical protein
MSFNLSDVKWGRVALWTVLGLVIAILVPTIFMVAYMVVLGFQMRGAPPREVQVAFLLGIPHNVVGLLATALGGFLGGRATARAAEASHQLNGLVVGIGLAIVRAAFSVFQFGTFTVWLPPHAILAIAGGCLGGWLAGRRAEKEL